MKQIVTGSLVFACLLGLFACKKPAQTPVPEKTVKQTAVQTPASETQPQTIPVPPVKKSSPEEIQALIQACKAGNLEKVKELIDAGVDVNESYRPPCPRSLALGESCPGRRIPLNEAVGAGHLMIVKELISAGANVNAGGALLGASARGNNKIVKELLAAGADVNFCPSHFPPIQPDCTALCLASKMGHVQVVKTLLAAGAKIHPKCRNSNVAKPGEDPLIEASRKGHVQVVKVLLEAGAKANIRDLKGSALAGAKNAEIVKLLKAAGAKE